MTTTQTFAAERYDLASDTLPAINLLVVIDAESLLNDYKVGDRGSFDTPKELPTGSDGAARYIYMTARNKNVQIGTKGSDLQIRAKKRDMVRWRETTLSLNSEYFGLLYRYKHHSGDFVFGKAGDQPDVKAELITSVTVPLPNKDKPDQPTTQTVNDYFWQGMIRETGTEYYYFHFMIMKVNDDNPKQLDKLAYFSWDPSIEVSH